jgi:hypothetical protein
MNEQQPDLPLPSKNLDVVVYHRGEEYRGPDALQRAMNDTGDADTGDAEAHGPVGAWPEDDLLMAAWGLIANAGGGNWETQTPEWQDAAVRWRDAFHRQL